MDMDDEFLKKYLQDAGLYEETMSKEHMVQCYKACKDSEKMSNVSQEIKIPDSPAKENLNIPREISVSPDPFALDERDPLEPSEIDPFDTLKENSAKAAFTPKKWSSENNDSLEKQVNGEAMECNNNKDIEEDSKQDSKSKKLEQKRPTLLERWDVENCFENLKKKLPDDHPFNTHKNILSLSLNERMELIYNYSEKRVRDIDAMANKCLRPAPVPKPINAQITKQEKEVLTESFSDFSETYCSRSGRLTKRKNYDFDEDSNEEVLSKKTKSEEEPEWLSKKNTKTPKTKSESDTSITPKSRLGLNSRKKLTNNEIMEKSSLFKDLPKPKSRVEKIAEKLQQDVEKKLETEMEHFDELLTIDDDSEEEKPKENTFKRIVPPNPGRRNIHQTKGNSDAPAPLRKTKYLNDLPIANTITVRRVDNEKKSDIEDTIKTNVIRNKPSSSKSSDEMVNCPICSKKFPKESVEEHASGCGDFADNDTPEQVASNVEQITCHVCDQVFLKNTFYEVHVNECIKQRMQSNLKQFV